MGEKTPDSGPIEYVLGLDDVRASLAVVGGKGAVLAQLCAAGLPVPPGFHVVTVAYDRFVRENGLQPRIPAVLAPVRADDPASLNTASGAITRLFLGGRMPEAVAGAIRTAYARLHGDSPAVAVRSSGTAEDLPKLSFAGQQETYLNIHGPEDVLKTVQRCWASLWTARAIGYRAQNHIPPNAVQIAVVVQVLVQADSAGILFTANPLNGRRDQAVINAAWGLGEAVVGGQVDPDTLIIDRAKQTVLLRETADKSIMTALTPTGTVEQPVPTTLRNVPVLDDKAALELVQLGERIEGLYRRPMDIEWARAEGRFAILQARPITALPASEG